MEATSTETPPAPFTSPDQPYYSPQLLQVRHAAHRRRAAAMSAPHDTILGLRFEPLTPASYSRLMVLESPFLWRHPNPSHAAIRNYLWSHWARWDSDGRGRPEFVEIFERRIVPTWLRWTFSRAARAALRARTAKGYDEAAAQISELVGIAFADAPSPAVGAPRQVCATLEAQMIDLFAERYHWAPERTRATPLRQLYQFIRCNDRSDYDPDEAAIMADDLRQENEAAAARRPVISPAAVTA